MLQGKPDNEMEVSGLKNARTLDEKQVRFHTVSTLCCILPTVFHRFMWRHFRQFRITQELFTLQTFQGTFLSPDSPRRLAYGLNL